MNLGRFELTSISSHSRARCGRLHLAHGIVETPVFMPVGTQATVKGMSPEDLENLGCDIVLCNAYHLYLRPGHELIEDIGGLHKFMGWNKPVLTDSGGFQVFSLSKLNKITDDGVFFNSPIDGSRHFFSPEISMQIQSALGSDIAMVFDECVSADADYGYVAESIKRTLNWERRSKQAHTNEKQLLFGIVQGGLFDDLRKASTAQVLELGFDGYAIGGLSVGESKELMLHTIDVVEPLLPKDKPRYLMGVGLPEDIVEAVARGIDMFDCVMPTRHARTGWLFTSSGRLVIKNAVHKRDERPIDETCECYTCRNFSRSYLRHLFMSRELLAMRLNTIHNIFYYMKLMQGIRSAIKENKYDSFIREFRSERA